MIENERQQTQKKSKCTQIKQNIKETFFIFYHNTLSSLTIPPIISVIILSLSYINILCFLIDEQTNIYISTNNADYIKMLPRIFSISYYFKHSLLAHRILLIIILCYLSFTLLFFITLLILFYRNYLRKSRKDNDANEINTSPSFKRALALYWLLCLLLYWIFLIPFLDISLGVYDVSTYNINDVTYITIGSINIFLIILLLIPHCLFGHSCIHSFTKLDGFSRVNCNFEFLYLILRVVLVLLYFFINKYSLTKWFLIAYHVVFSIIAIGFNVNKYIFYCKLMSSFLFYYQLLHLYMSIIAILICLSDYNEPFWFLAIGVILLRIATKGIIGYVYTTLVKSTEFPSLISKPYLIDQYMKHLCFLLVSKSENDNALLSGISDYLDKECNLTSNVGNNLTNNNGVLLDSAAVPLTGGNGVGSNSVNINNNNNGSAHNTNNNATFVKNNNFINLFIYDVFYIPKKGEYMTKENYMRKEKYYDLCFLLSLFTFYIKSTKQITVLLSYLNFQYEIIGNYLDLLFTLYSAMSTSSSLSTSPISSSSSFSLSTQDEFSLYRFKLMALNKCASLYNYSFNEIEKTKLQIHNVIDYYTLVSLLKRKMIESANQSYTFWNNFIYNNENKNIYKSGLDIFESNFHLEQLFNQIRSIYSGDDYLAMKFSEYIRNVKGDERLAMKYQQNNDNNNFLVEHFDELREMEKLNNLKEFFFSVDSVIFLVHFTHDRNLIEKCSESLYSIFGYTAHQMIGKEIENFMPPFFKERHQAYMNFHFLTGTKGITGRTVMLYGYNSKHFCFCVKVMVMHLPLMQEHKLLYMAVVQKLNTDYGIILVYPNGKIDSISEKLSKFLGLTNEDIVENEIAIYHIVMGLLTYIKNGKEKIIENINTFTMTQYELTKMKFCTDANVVINFRKALKQYESNTRHLLIEGDGSGNIAYGSGSSSSNQRYHHRYNNSSGINNKRKEIFTNNNTNVNSLKEIINMYINSLESANWPMLETEIIEENYHVKVDKTNNSLFCVRVFLEDDDEDAGNNINANGVNGANGVNNNHQHNNIHNVSNNIQQRNTFGTFADDSKVIQEESELNYTANNNTFLGAALTQNKLANNNNNNNSEQLQLLLQHSNNNNSNDINDSSKAFIGGNSIAYNKRDSFAVMNPNRIVIKHLNIPSTSSKNRIYDLLKEEQLNMQNIKQNNRNVRVYEGDLLIRMKRYDALSSMTSNLSSTLYTNYSTFRKKLQKHLTENPRSLFAQVTGIVLFLLELAASAAIFYFEYTILSNIKESFAAITAPFAQYDDLHCLIKLFNDDMIQKLILNTSRTQHSIALFNECSVNIIRNQKTISKITNNDIINDIKLEYLNLNITSVTMFNDKEEMPAMQLMMLLVDNMQKLNKTIPWYTIDSPNLNFVKQNIFTVIQELYDSTQYIDKDIFDNKLLLYKQWNYIALALRLAFIVICFIIVLPVLVIKKKEQIKVLENFFQIRTEDAELQKEACKRFLEASTNFKFEDNAANNNNNNNNNGHNGEDGVKKGNNKLGDNNNNNNNGNNNDLLYNNNNNNKINDDLIIDKNAFDVHKKRKGNKNNNNKLKPNSKSSNINSNTALTSSNGVNNTNMNSNNKPISFTSKIYILTTLLLLICIIILLSIIPILEFFYQTTLYDKAITHLNNKHSVDLYAYNMESTMISTQDIILTSLLNHTQLPSTINAYNATYKELFESEVAFSDFTSIAYDLTYYDDLYTFLQKDMCTIFTAYGHAVVNCSDVEGSNAQKGIKPIYSQITSILTDISQAILVEWEELNYDKAYALYKSNNYQYLSMIIDQFVIEGFNLILEILVRSFEDMVNYQTTLIIVFICLFGVILIINQFVVWNSISTKIHSMETDTLKLFAILPIGFITEYTSLMEFLNKITKEDN